MWSLCYFTNSLADILILLSEVCNNYQTEAKPTFFTTVLQPIIVMV